MVERGQTRPDGFIRKSQTQLLTSNLHSGLCWFFEVVESKTLLSSRNRITNVKNMFPLPILLPIKERVIHLKHSKGGSPGLVVMGDNSCLKGRGFESRRRILDGHLDIFTFICCKNCNVCLKRPKINKKEAGVVSK